MRKRLRKKLRVGEFRELGFEVRFRLPESWNDADVESFWDMFIGDAIEGQGLICGGGCGREWDIMVMRPSRASATDIDREWIARWLGEHPAITGVIVGSLKDMWHDQMSPDPAQQGGLRRDTSAREAHAAQEAAGQQGAAAEGAEPPPLTPKSLPRTRAARSARRTGCCDRLES